MLDIHARLTILPICCLLYAIPPALADEGYRLGPQDQVQVKVSDFRSATGEAYQWTAFAGEFSVGPSGRLSLPVLGELDASGKTTAELEAEIASKLQAKAGLAAKPDASVQIVTFRPFYVMGSVDKPGEYEYRPGLTVLQAVSLAGGMQRVPTDALLGFARDALNSRGDLRVLSADRIAFLARQARLDAEIAGSASITFPDEVRLRASEPDVGRIMREEQLLFDSQRSGLQAQVTTINQNKDYLRHEIEELNAKDQTIADQLEATKGELEQITNLMNKGLSSTNRLLELKQNTGQIEANKLDVQLAITRAHEDISKSDRDILELQTKRRNDAFEELSEVRVKLAETVEKIATAQALVVQDEARAPMAIVADSTALQQPDFFLARRTNGKSETIPAHEDDLVQPGDVVRVVPKLLPRVDDSAEATGAGRNPPHAASAF